MVVVSVSQMQAVVSQLAALGCPAHLLGLGIGAFVGALDEDVTSSGDGGGGSGSGGGRGSLAPRLDAPRVAAWLHATARCGVGLRPRAPVHAVPGCWLFDSPHELDALVWSGGFARAHSQATDSRPLHLQGSLSFGRLQAGVVSGFVCVTACVRAAGLTLGTQKACTRTCLSGPRPW
jgi:hypothetical protein